MLLLDLQTLLRDQEVLDQERAHTYHRTCETALLLVLEIEWVVANMREMTWLLCVSQT
jgi:hypothetical protein